MSAAIGLLDIYVAISNAGAYFGMQLGLVFSLG